MQLNLHNARSIVQSVSADYQNSKMYCALKLIGFSSFLFVSNEQLCYVMNGYIYKTEPSYKLIRRGADKSLARLLPDVVGRN